MRGLINRNVWRCLRYVEHNNQPSCILSRKFSQNADQSSTCHYETLGVKSTATKDEIRAAYLQKSKLYHPDLNPDDVTKQQKFIAVNEAYSILGNQTNRNIYDTVASQASATGGFRRRTPGSQGNPFGDYDTVDYEWSEEEKKQMYEELHKYYQEQGEAYRENLATRSKRNSKLLGKLFVIVLVCNIIIVGIIYDGYTRYTVDAEKKTQENAEILRTVRNSANRLAPYIEAFQKGELTEEDAEKKAL